MDVEDDAHMGEGQAGDRVKLENNQESPEQDNQQNAEPQNRQAAEPLTDDDCDWRPGSLSYLLENRKVPRQAQPR